MHVLDLEMPSVNGIDSHEIRRTISRILKETIRSVKTDPECEEIAVYTDWQNEQVWQNHMRLETYTKRSR